jgi:hypothetical protein
LKWILRLVLAGLGIVLFAGLVRSVGPSEIANGIRLLGWGFGLLVALGGCSQLVRTWAWRFTFKRDETPRYFELLKIRLAGEAVSQLTFGGHIVGETTRAILLRRHLSLVRRVGSVVIDRGMFLFTSSLVIAAGLGTGLYTLGLDRATRQSALIAAVGFGSFIVLATIVFQKRWPVLSRTLGQLRRIGRLRSWSEARIEEAREMETLVFDFYQESQGCFWASFLLHLLGHVLSLLEIFLVLRWLGAPVSLLESFMMEAMSKVVNSGGLVIPGNIGTLEAGNMVILRLMGYSAALGLTLALARRLRGLTWAAVGLTFLYFRGFSQENKLADK